MEHNLEEGMKRSRFCILVFLVLLTSLLGCGPGGGKSTVKSTLEAAEEDPFINYNKGVMLFKKKEFSMAASYLSRAVQLEPSNGAYWNVYGLSLAQMGELDAAIEAFQKALEAEPDLTDIHNNLGMVYTEKKDYDKALEEYGLVLQDKTYPNPEFPYFNIGLLKLKQGKQEEAMVAFEQVVTIKPEFYRAFGELAAIYYRMGMYGDSYNAVKKAQKQNAGDPALLLLEARSQVKLGRINDANRVLTKLNLLYPPKHIREAMDDLKIEIARKMREGE